jgi:trk system potassium uptake protein TrkA
MDFIVVGGGRVGLRTAQVLEDEDHAVTVVERDPDRVERARDRGLTAVEGDASREPVLKEAGIEDVDAIGALSGDLADNFAACLIGDHHGARTVMRIDEDYREDIYRRYADQVDEIVHPERLGAIAAKNALVGGTIRAIADVESNLQVLELTIGDDSPTRGYTISELELPAHARILAFGKRDGPMGIPLPDDSLDRGDRLAVLADFDVLDNVRRILVGDPGPAGGA